MESIITLMLWLFGIAPFVFAFGANEIVAGAGGSGIDVMAEALSRDIRDALMERGRLAATVRIEDISGENATQKRYQTHPTFSDSVLTEVEEAANVAWSPSEAMIGTNRYGLALERSDLHQTSGIVSGGELADLMVGAIDEGLEARIGALYANFTLTGVNRTTAVLRIEDMLAGMLTYRQAKGLMSRGQPIAAINPKQSTDLQMDLATVITGSVMGTEGAGAAAFFGGMDGIWPWAGVLFVETNNTASVNGDADWQGALYPAGQRGPLIWQIKRGVFVEVVRGERNARAGSTTAVCSIYYDVGTLAAAEGLTITSVK